MKPERDRGATQFDELHTLLGVAQQLVSELLTDPLLPRLLHAFMMLPPADREPILAILEKDAAWRRIVEQTESATGIDVRPNPNASLYLHVLAPVDGPPLDGDALARDGEIIRFGLDTFVQLLPLIFQDGVHAQWTAAAREIIGAAGQELRTYGTRLAREVLDLLGEAGPNGGRVNDTLPH